MSQENLHNFVKLGRRDWTFEGGNTWTIKSFTMT